LCATILGRAKAAVWSTRGLREPTRPNLAVRNFGFWPRTLAGLSRGRTEFASACATSIQTTNSFFFKKLADFFFAKNKNDVKPPLTFFLSCNTCKKKGQLKKK
jgi:hypothetical protein